MVMNRRKHTGRAFENPENDGKVRRYVHSPFSIEHNENVRASCDKDGKVTITVSEKGKEEYDEVVVPASLIFRLQSMLTDTRKIRWIPKDEETKDSE